MADKQTKTPPTPAPAPTAPAGGDDFAKFTSALPAGGALPDNILAQIVTDPPSGPVPPVKTPGVGSVPVAPGQPPVGGKRNIEEEALLAYRGMLAQEEARLASLPPVKPLYAAPAQSVVPTAFGAGAAELVVREGADPLNVESFKILRRLVAGGMIQPGAFDPRQLFTHLNNLRAAIEYAPKPADPVATA